MYRIYGYIDPFLIDVVVHYTAVAEEFQDLRNQTLTQSRHMYTISKFLVI